MSKNTVSRVSGGWIGSKSGTWHNEQDLKKLVLADCKAAGIPATVRFRRGGWHTTMTMTLRVKRCEIVPYAEWCKGYDGPDLGAGNSYTGPDGRVSWLRADLLLAMTGKQRLDMEENIRATEYAQALEFLQSHSISLPDRDIRDILRPAAYDRLQKAQEIVDSYNRDESDVMTDYFDRDIYDWYAVKLVD